MDSHTPEKNLSDFVDWICFSKREKIRLNFHRSDIRYFRPHY
ncbi:hypothetical protein LEP1GSC060_1229 [Leptospira weilii serovar Ranarum str. ICFT]|uniref:Uncharacterized protein n=1 Tax=Leptospira weilii serovar Ranarum str. ICFT TaxID=1218598 RepID=N1WBR7_9LEPT|nr:hypothetical protein LEP1GSC060_1229 [Leptospira weilii serovar Ranarum str. ICFT]